MRVPLEFFEHCVFISVDFQSGPRDPQARIHYSEQTLPPLWKNAGITADDANAAIGFFHETALPNAVRVADACRSLGLTMIFVHWGYLFRDAIDLDPVVRAEFLSSQGPDQTKWPHYIGDPSSRPAPEFKVREGEYVLPKSAQDAFASSNLDFMLRNLQCRNIVFIGGHANACLGKTAASARVRGYKTLCVEDATCDAAESWRLTYIAGHYDYVVTTRQFLALVARRRKQVT